MFIRQLISQYLLIITGILMVQLSECSNSSNKSTTDNTTTVLPVVMWHGMGDTCCFPFSMGSIKTMIENNLQNDVYVKSLKIGGNIIEDYRSGFFIHPDKQVDDVCEQLKNDEKLANGYNAIGFSQGGQFLRAIAQRCPEPKMNVLITMGGQHQGIFGLPKCPSISFKTCEYFRTILSYAAYESWVQKALVQATYWHDPLREDKYKEKSTFLSDINNEMTINEEYKNNIQNLKKFVMVKFMNDSIVQPRESQWFEFYAPGQDKEITPFMETPLYTEDRLGLRKLESENKLQFLETEGDHLQFTAEWFIANIIPLLKEN